MTTTIKSETVNKFYIEIESIEDYFKVSACPEYESGLCGYPVKQNTYRDLNIAKARYNFLKRKALQGDL